MAQDSGKSARPKNVTVDREAHELRITWRDEHESAYELNALREACPCASCRGGHEYMGASHDPDFIELKPARSYRVEQAELVGNYALQIYWSDGHSSGIYTWEYLRRICPCLLCQQTREMTGDNSPIAD